MRWWIDDSFSILVQVKDLAMSAYVCLNPCTRRQACHQQTSAFEIKTLMISIELLS